MKLIRGNEKDLYRLYKDSEGTYHHFTGKKKDIMFKAKRHDRPIKMKIGHFPVSNFKIKK